MKVNVTGDIRKYKTKDIGNFTFVECLFILIAAGFLIGGTVIFHSFELGFIPAAITIAFCFARPMKMPLRKFLKMMVGEYTSPKKYYYESEFTFESENFEDLEKEIREIFDDNEIQLFEPESLVQREKTLVVSKEDKNNLY